MQPSCICIDVLFIYIFRLWCSAFSTTKCTLYTVNYVLYELCYCCTVCTLWAVCNLFTVCTVFTVCSFYTVWLLYSVNYVQLVHCVYCVTPGGKCPCVLGRCHQECSPWETPLVAGTQQVTNTSSSGSDQLISYWPQHFQGPRDLAKYNPSVGILEKKTKNLS